MDSLRCAYLLGFLTCSRDIFGGGAGANEAAEGSHVRHVHVRNLARVGTLRHDVSTVSHTAPSQRHEGGRRSLCRPPIGGLRLQRQGQLPL